MDQGSEIIQINDVLTMLPTLSFDSIETYVDVFIATYDVLGLMKTPDRKLMLQKRRQHFAFLEEISGIELKLKFSCNGFDIDYVDIEEVMDQSRINLDVCALTYCDAFRDAAHKVIEEKTEKQELERTEKNDGKGTSGCFLCRFKKWVKKIMSRKN